MTKEVDDLLRENLKLNGHSHNRKFFRELMGVKKSRGNELYNKWFRTVEPEGVPGTVEIKTNDKYSYNTENDTYVINLKSMAKPLVLQGFIHRAIHKAYSSYGDDLATEELCRKYGISPEIFDEYKRIFKLSKNSLPLTLEVIESNSIEESSCDILEQKKFRIFQDFEKKSWKETQERANKWTQYQIGVLDPIENILSNWSPPEYKPYKVEKSGDGDYNILICLSDQHFGCASNGNTLFRGNGHSTQYTVDCVRALHQRITKDISDMGLKVRSVTCLGMGDFLHSSNPYSTTTKGTVVKSDFIGEEMFDIALDSLAEFIYNISLISPLTRVKSVKGNHFGLGDSILFKTLSVYFKDQKNIEFEITKAPAIAFRERNSFCIGTHGAHDSIKAKFGPGNKTQMYAQSLFIHSLEKESGIKSRHYFSADLHHSEMKEFNDFTYHLCPSLVRNDEYSDALGLSSRSAQSCFIFDDNGIKMSLNYYF